MLVVSDMLTVLGRGLVKVKALSHQVECRICFGIPPPGFDEVKGLASKQVSGRRAPRPRAWSFLLRVGVSRSVYKSSRSPKSRLDFPLHMTTFCHYFGRICDLRIEVAIPLFLKDLAPLSAEELADMRHLGLL